MEGGRRKIAGSAAIAQALARGDALRLIVVDGERADAAARALEAPAREAGVPLQSVGARHFDRLRPPGGPGGAVALVGPRAPRDAADVLARVGPAWLLHGIVYPGNAGMAIRSAEVSGAAGVFIDAAFDHAKRREALRASRGGPEAYDGVAELWWDSLEQMQKVLGTEQAQAAVAELIEDEHRFADLSRSPIFLAEERQIL